MSTEPKHQRISAQLVAEIAAGRYGPSGRLPSEAQLVQRFQVSRPTVARALRDLQEQGLIDRRTGSGTFVRRPAAERPEVVGRQLGLLIPGLGTTEIFEVICGELAGLARVHDYGLLWGSSSYPLARGEWGIAEAEVLCEQFIQRRVAGVFLAPFEGEERQEEVNLHLAERLSQAGVAVVLLDRDLRPFPARSALDLVGMDQFAAGFLAAEHLLKLGCCSLRFLVAPHSAPTVAARVSGAREAMLQREVRASSGFLHLGEPDDPQTAAHLTSGGADAVICQNDRAAAVLLRSLAKAGIRVPQDLRVVGFDDVKYSILLSVPLTTVHQPCREIAVAAFRAMQDRIAEPALPARGIALTPRLVVRESCGAYLPSAQR